MADSTDPGLKSTVTKNEECQQGVKIKELDIQTSSPLNVQPVKVYTDDNQATKNLPQSISPSPDTGADYKATGLTTPNEEYSVVASSGGDGIPAGLTLPKEETLVGIIPLIGEKNVEVMPLNVEYCEPSTSMGNVVTIMTLHDNEFGTTVREPGHVEVTSSQESMVPAVSSEENFITSDEERLTNDFQDLSIEATDSLTLLSVSDTDCRAGESGYELKRIQWHNRIVPIVTQNENGPCPLIAIANVLLLRGKILIPAILKVVTAEQLMEFVADCIMENIPLNLSGISQLNYEQNMHDAIGVLPRLLTGLDVNVRFTGVRDFEYTPECIIFDLLNIPLYHGWLVDPQAKEIMTAVGNLGYNQLVEKIIVNKFSDDSDAITQALTAEMFLENSATQLTYHGLCELNSAMVSNELAILFRNNHFSTIYKKGVDKPVLESAHVCEAAAIVSRENELFQLVTDQGFLNEPRVVWEALCNIEGDSLFVDGNFIDSPPKNAEAGPGPGSFVPLPQSVSTEQQINQEMRPGCSRNLPPEPAERDHN